MSGKHPHRTGMWLALAVGIAAASMSASKHHKADRPAGTISRAAPHVTLVFPLN